MKLSDLGSLGFNMTDEVAKPTGTGCERKFSGYCLISAFFEGSACLKIVMDVG